MRSTCAGCSAKYAYAPSRGMSLDYCSICIVARRRWRLKAKCVAYLGGKCVRCGYKKSHAALDFHHRDPKTKLFSIAARLGSSGWAALRPELDKCDLVCANCHREIEEEAELRTRKGVDLRTTARFNCAHCGKFASRVLHWVEKRRAKNLPICCSRRCEYAAIV